MDLADLVDLTDLVDLADLANLADSVGGCAQVPIRTMLLASHSMGGTLAKF